MGTVKDMEFVYSTIDQIFRHSLGEHGDFSCALYNGDYSLSLEDAQRRKHEFIRDQLGLTAGSRVVDLGCGWGPFLNFAREIGATGVGFTLSSSQAETCRRDGLEAYVEDCRTLTPEKHGRFDAAVSLGAFEHFCTKEESKAGQQDEIYRDFFRHVSGLIPAGARFYLQTMTFGRNMIGHDDLDITAHRDSDAFIVASMEKQFPGSWLPYGVEQIERTAAPYFKVVSENSGRLDYIETIKQWKRRYARFSPRKYAYYATLIPRYLTNKELRDRLHPNQIRSNLLCFEREIMDHTRMVLENIAPAD